MKKGLFFKLSLLFVSVLFLRNSFAQDSPQWRLPETVKARLGKGRISEFQYSPAGTRLAVASSIGIWFYDTATLQEVDLFTGHTSWVTSIAFSPAGGMLASGGGREDNTIRLWDATTGEHKRTLTGHSWAVHSVAFSPDGKMLASGSGDQTIRLWDVATGEFRQILTGHTSRVDSVSFSPDGRTLASGGGWQDDIIRFWDIATGEQKGILAGHTAGVSDVAFSPDGRILASSSYDATVRLWDAVTGEHIRTLTGHKHDVLSLAFSPYGRTLASGSRDETTRLWDVATGEQKETLAGHTGWIGTVAFSPDGRTLATGSEDGTLFLWELPPPTVFGDVNRDGVVNLQDLMHVSLSFGRIGQNDTDLNGDGAVNILDLVTVAGTIGEAAAAPSAHPVAFGALTAAEVRSWFTQAQGLDLTDLRLRRGIFFLEQLLAALIPKETGLLPNYPNPFNPETWIPYHLAYASDVTLTIYNATGAMVRQLDLGHQAAGFYVARSRAAYWDGRNQLGESIASGLYFYTLTAGDFTATRKMSILK